MPYPYFYIDIGVLDKQTVVVMLCWPIYVVYRAQDSRSNSKYDWLQVGNLDISEFAAAAECVDTPHCCWLWLMLRSVNT